MNYNIESNKVRGNGKVHTVAADGSNYTTCGMSLNWSNFHDVDDNTPITCKECLTKCELTNAQANQELS